MPVNTHPYTNEEVMAYLDGELSPEAAAEMKAHLGQCRICQDVAADLQGVSRQLSGWMVDVEGEGIPANIARALDEKAKKPTPRGRWQVVVQRPWIVVTAVFLIFVAVPFFPLFNRRRAEVKSDVGSSERALADVAMAVPPSISESTRPGQRAHLMLAGPVAESSVLLVVHTAELRVTAYNFNTVRTDLDRILIQFSGHVAQLNVTSPGGEARNLSATLRIPSAQLEAALAELRKLGRVDGESQQGEEVTKQSVDLEARLSNARHTEQRLTQILATRTGKLSDVLEVEQKLSEIRGEIERAEAEQKSLNNRISFATVSLVVAEDYRAPLTGATAVPSISTRLSNAAVDGLHTAFDGVIGLLRFLLVVGPSLLLFGALLGLPAYFLWKKLWHR